jgi:sugar (pentulose or hexulose) kinase
VITINPLYLVIDLGTGSLRASLFSPREGIIALVKKELQIGPRVDAHGVWLEIESLISTLLQDNRNPEITCIGISSLLGWVAVGSDGLPVVDAWTWMHQEAGQFEQFQSKVPPDLYQRIGRRFNAELGALKWKELKENNSQIYDRVDKFISLKDYLKYQLTGSYSMDFTHAGYTGVFSLKELGWDHSLLHLFGLDVEKMPPLFYASEITGNITKQVMDRTGLKAGIPVINGGPDGSIAILGGGGVAPGDAVDVMGTTDVFFGVADKPVIDSNESLVNNPHLLPNLWLTGGPMGMTCGTAKWFVNQWNVSDDNESMALFESMAIDVPAGSSDLLFIPSLTGERTPVWNPAIRGSLVGLKQDHTKGHMYRALLEGNGYSLQNVFSILEESGFSFQHYVAIGGGAKSSLALQIRASITGKRIIVPNVVEASTLGVAILCGLAVKDFEDPIQAVSHLLEVATVVDPNLHLKELYQAGHKNYQKLLHAMEFFYSKPNSEVSE